MHPMYHCKACSKTYGSRATLSRHERNHRKSAKHYCEECQINFTRRDLLNRHLEIHSSARSGTQSRRRCHTACQRCKESRCKCDGGQPCQACASAGEDCFYPPSRWRTSEHEPSQRTDADVLPPAHLNTLDNPSLSESPALPVPHELQLESEPPASSLVVHRPAPNSLAPLDNNMFSSMAPGMQPGSIPDDNIWPWSSWWPWTHENAFFQQDTQMTDGLNEFLLPDQDFGLNMPTSNILEQHDPSKMLEPGGTSAEKPISPVSLSARAAVEPNAASHTQTNEQKSTKSRLIDVVENIVKLATSHHSTSIPIGNHQWQYYSSQLSQIVGDQADVDMLKIFVEQYFDNFHNLWPLVFPDYRASTRLHPALYLTLTSIGALYSTSAKAAYGSLMHKSLRTVLLDLPLGRDHTRSQGLDVGIAMLLTQVAALYFEQEQAFSAAEKLGSALVSLAHRMRIFSPLRVAQAPAPADPRKPSAEDELQESQRMLAFGMLRAETFLSVLFNRKPRLSYEEMNLPPPRLLWMQPLAGLGQGKTPATPPPEDHFFSDLVRIALDKEEALPALRPIDVELMLFGLQSDVWRFCQDPEIFDRLGVSSMSSLQSAPPISVLPKFSNSVEKSGVEDPLNLTARRMRNFKQEYQRTVDALNDWKKTMNHVQLSHHPDHYRSIYLSGLILYELSFLRLNAPVEAIQQVAYQFHEPSANDNHLLHQIYRWTCREDAVVAVRHAGSIYHLLKKETSRTREPRTKYNIMTLIAIHHAAAVFWAVTGSEDQVNRYVLQSICSNTEDSQSIALRRGNTSKLMHQFADLCSQITRSWGLQSSFTKMIQQLALNPLPPCSRR